MMRRVGALWLLITLAAAATQADPGTIRVATYNIELTRDGPGLALRDIQTGDDAAD